MEKAWFEICPTSIDCYFSKNNPNLSKTTWLDQSCHILIGKMHKKSLNTFWSSYPGAKCPFAKHEWIEGSLILHSVIRGNLHWFCVLLQFSLNYRLLVQVGALKLISKLYNGQVTGLKKIKTMLNLFENKLWNRKVSETGGISENWNHKGCSSWGCPGSFLVKIDAV